MLNKKGLSDVIATVLIILLALAAIVIVWSFIQPAIEGTGVSVTASQKCFDTEVRPLSCVPNSPTSATAYNVKIQWMKGGTTGAQVIAIIKDPTGTSVASGLTALPTGAQTVTVQNVGAYVDGSKARAQAVIKDDNGNDVICPESPTEITCTAGLGGG